MTLTGPGKGCNCCRLVGCSTCCVASRQGQRASQWPSSAEGPSLWGAEEAVFLGVGRRRQSQGRWTAHGGGGRVFANNESPECAKKGRMSSPDPSARLGVRPQCRIAIASRVIAFLQPRFQDSGPRLSSLEQPTSSRHLHSRDHSCMRVWHMSRPSHPPTAQRHSPKYNSKNSRFFFRSPGAPSPYGAVPCVQRAANTETLPNDTAVASPTKESLPIT